MHMLGFHDVHSLDKLWILRESSTSAVQPQEDARQHDVASPFDSRCLQRDIQGGQEKQMGQLLIVLGALGGSEGNYQGVLL